MSDEKKIRPQDRWNKKNGYISKSFKMYRSLADEFKAVTDSQGKTQSEVIQQLMRDYIKQNKVNLEEDSEQG